MLYTIGIVTCTALTAIAITLEIVILGPILAEVITETIADIRNGRNQEEE